MLAHLFIIDNAAVSVSVNRFGSSLAGFGVKLSHALDTQAKKKPTG